MSNHKKPLYKRRWVQVLSAFVVFFVIFIGPWPSNRSHYKDSWYAKATFQRLAKFTLDSESAMLLASVSTIEITPPVGEPMAGYGARSPMESDGIASSVYAKAITFSNGRETVTLVAADILLMTPQLRGKILEKANLSASEVYFTASHNHSGPGGYESGVYQLVLGKYSPAITERMAGLFAEAIKKSRESLEPVLIANQRIKDVQQNHPFIQNRIDKNSKPYDTIFVSTVYRENKEILANLVVASAHATCIGRRNHKICGDYPGILQSKVQEKHNCKCFFLAGAVGSMKAKGEGKYFVRAENVANNIEKVVTEAIKNSEQISRSKIALATGIITVDLPSQNYSLGKYLRLSPFIMSAVHNRQSYIQVLRLDKFVFFAMPCDYSGELAAVLEKTDSPYIPVITSFNGDYIGYLVTRNRYDTPHYETRTMNFFGPWSGEYFNEIAERVLKEN